MNHFNIKQKNKERPLAQTLLNLVSFTSYPLHLHHFLKVTIQLDLDGY
jgi:hypothetical protein